MHKTLSVAVVALLLLSGCAIHSQTVRNGWVHLSLRAPAAGEVLFVSSLDGYRRHPLTRDGKLWETAVPARREFRYFYIVDGQVFAPPCRLRERDDFGSENCLYCPER